MNLDEDVVEQSEHNVLPVTGNGKAGSQKKRLFSCALATFRRSIALPPHYWREMVRN